MDKPILDLILGVVGAVMMLLLGGNLYFIKRLVDKLDYVVDAIGPLKVKVHNLEKTVERMQSSKRNRKPGNGLDTGSGYEPV